MYIWKTSAFQFLLLIVFNTILFSKIVLFHLDSSSAFPSKIFVRQKFTVFFYRDDLYEQIILLVFRYPIKVSFLSFVMLYPQ